MGTKYISHSRNDTIFTKKLLNKQWFKLTPGFYTKSNPRKGFTGTPVLGDWIKGLVVNFCVNLWCKLNIEWPIASVVWCCWLGGRKVIRPVKTEWWGAGVVICLGWGADLHMAQQMPLQLTISCSSESRLVLPFWYRLNRVIPYKIQKSHKTLP